MQVSAGLLLQMIVLQQFRLVLKSFCLPKPRVFTVFMTVSTQKPIHLLWGEYDIQVQGDGSISVPNSVSSPREVTKLCSYNMVEAISTCGVLAELSGTNLAFQAIHWMPVVWLRGEDSCHPTAKLPPQSEEQIPFIQARAATENNHILQHCPSNIVSAIAVIPIAGKFWLNYLTSQYLELELKAIESIELFFPYPIKLWS